MLQDVTIVLSIHRIIFQIFSDLSEIAPLASFFTGGEHFSWTWFGLCPPYSSGIFSLSLSFYRKQQSPSVFSMSEQSLCMLQMLQLLSIHDKCLPGHVCRSERQKLFFCANWVGIYSSCHHLLTITLHRLGSLALLFLITIADSETHSPT